MARKPTGNPNGRPPKQIDRRQFEAMCHIFCTRSEIAAVFDVDEDTLSAWCKREYGETFSAVYKKKIEGGKASLRRTIMKQAEKSAAVAIFIAKNHLGMRDEQTVEHKVDPIRIVNDIPVIAPEPPEEEAEDETHEEGTENAEMGQN